MRTALLVAALSIGACSSGAPVDGGADAVDAALDLEPCPPMPATGDLPCDVGAVLAAKCQVCHTVPRKNGAPFPLLSYEQTHEQFGTTALLKWQRMAQVIEPGNLPHMPPADHPQLDPGDFATLHAWFNQCAPPVPEGSGCDANEDGGAAPDGGAPPDGAAPSDGDSAG
jgi:hypothetical protein